MLRRQFVSKTLTASVSNSVAACAAAVIGARASAVKTNDPTYEDDRWLEAEIATSPEMTVEERYAREKQRELMKKLLNKSREDAKAHAQAHVEEHKATQKAELDAMKKQLADLHAKVAAAEGKK